ncbi:thioredoxin domain-containing protein [uncultured Serinicoccus sp.]|uniref:DsbA family protein n=1 Tax=uncultured Serinicoccus sp. TaxID=735514 RepID=UPI00261FEA56|nr:thioredoxin domain-containing protein [uncultured Serinicoccus sp.]
MSTPTSPQPRTDRTVVAVAWAVAAVVVALVTAFIAWLALGERGSEQTAAPSQTVGPEATPAPDEDGADAGGTQGDGGPQGDGGSAPQGSAAPDEGSAAQPPPADPGAAEQTPPPEVAQMMLDLQRRDPQDPMAVGEVDAPVVMIEYADYRCPYCAQFHLEIRPELLPLVEDGTLRIEFRDFVIFDETSRLAAVAGRAAAEQDRLEEFQSAVFALSTDGHGEYGQAELVDLAEEVGVADPEQFEADLDDADLAAAVEADSAEARAIGVSSTPTFLINTQVLQGAYPADRMLEIIEEQRQDATQRS